MHLKLLFVLFAVGLFAKCVHADEDNEVKRGVYPYMAVVYYPDKTILDGTGGKLTRGAVLIRPDWLISSSLENHDTALSFPKETLVARIGAVRIDSRFTINEDEGEQEREIVQIARPYSYNASEWWSADISVLKTLLPFNISSPASIGGLSGISLNDNKNCLKLIYSALGGNKSGDRMLMQIPVDLLPPTPENCGPNFVKSMICGTDVDSKMEYFCEGNSGSPLICNNNVVGIQTYIYDCKPPHLYQYLNSWETLVTCALEDNCQDEQCASICNVIYKDPADIVISVTPPSILVESKLYPDEIAHQPSIDTMLTTTMLRRLLPNDSFTIFDNVSNNEASNTETTVPTSSTVVYTKEIEITSDTEVTPTPTGNAEQEQETSTHSVSSLSISYNTESDTKHYVYKTEELVSKVEELKNLIDENVALNNSLRKPVHPHHKIGRSAAVTTQHPCYIIYACLVLFYLQISFIVNSC